MKRPIKLVNLKLDWSGKKRGQNLLISEMKDEMTIHSSDINTIIDEYYKKYYTIYFDNFDEMDTFF